MNEAIDDPADRPITAPEPTITPKRYYMVHCQTGRPPTKMHERQWEAEAEAKRLAEKQPGEIFNVLEVIGSYWQAPNVEYMKWPQ